MEESTNRGIKKDYEKTRTGVNKLFDFMKSEKITPDEMAVMCQVYLVLYDHASKKGLLETEFF